VNEFLCYRSLFTFLDFAGSLLTNFRRASLSLLCRRITDSRIRSIIALGAAVVGRVAVSCCERAAGEADFRGRRRDILHGARGHDDIIWRLPFTTRR